MWPITVLEVLFGGSMATLAVDILGRKSSFARGYGAGLVAAGALAASLAALVMDWGDSLGATVVLQPVTDPLASLYVVDKLTTFVGFTILLVGLVVSLYSMTYFRRTPPTPFYALFLVLVLSLIGVASAGDYLVLFLFWEGMSISAYGLVSSGRGEVIMEASLKYFLMAGVGSLLALYGIAAIYFSTGSIQLQSAAGLFVGGSTFSQLGLTLLIVGLGVEAAVVPLHTWLPDVYTASAIPVAAVVSGAVTGTGVFALVKVVQPIVMTNLGNAWDLQLFLGSLALVTMVIGNLSALAQGNLRRILSFSSIAQTGYMLAALSTLSAAGLVAVVFTIWNHGLLKSNFFMLIGKENPSVQSSDLENLRGLGRSDRRLGFMFASSSLGMMGAPPFGMFWSEILIIQSLLAASSSFFILLAAAVLLSIVMSIGYYFRVINTVVFGEPAQASPPRRPSDLAAPMVLLGLSLATGVLPFLILGRVL